MKKTSFRSDGLYGIFSDSIWKGESHQRACVCRCAWWPSDSRRNALREKEGKKPFLLSSGLVWNLFPFGVRRQYKQSIKANQMLETRLKLFIEVLDASNRFLRSQLGGRHIKDDARRPWGGKMAKRSAEQSGKESNAIAEKTTAAAVAAAAVERER